MEESDGKRSRRDRMMGKLFKGGSAQRERRLTDQETANDISSFLGNTGNADSLKVTHPVPPPPPMSRAAPPTSGPPSLALDTSKVSRFPQSYNVDGATQQTWSYQRAKSHSPPQPKKPKKKPGLVVRFTDKYPEVIGEGGDECETIVAEIGKRKRSKSAPAPSPIAPKPALARAEPTPKSTPKSSPNADGDDFIPGPIRRTQTGFSSVADLDDDEPPAQPPPLPNQARPRALPAGELTPSRFLDTNPRKDENRRSFIEIHQQEQRQAEGLVMRSSSTHELDDPTSSPEPVRETPPRRRQIMPNIPTMQEPIDMSPASTTSNRPAMPIQYSQQSLQSLQSLPVRDRSQSLGIQGVEDLIPTLPASERSPVRGGARPQIPSPFTNDPVALQQPDISASQPADDNADSPSSSYSASSYSNSANPASATSVAQKVGPLLPETPVSTSLDPSRPPAIDGALEVFLARTKHLYELFRLYAEQMRPLETCQPEELGRAALWWFLKGRTSLEVAVRNRSADPDEPKGLMARYQAYTDLSKGYWLAEQALPDIAGGKYSPMNGELGEVRHTLVTNLKKLCGSMQRNNFLPPEEPFLPQTMDKSIWVEYPVLTQDLVALLNGNWASALNGPQESSSHYDLLQTLPIGDTSKDFTYGRVPADVYLMEQGNKSSQKYFPCVVSVIRPRNEPNIVFSIASQNGTVTLHIQSDRNRGAVWQDVKWRRDVNSLEVKLPRGFLLAAQCSPTDFKMLWGMYDFSAKIQSYLYPRRDEVLAFQTTLQGFHYFDSNPQGRTFPREAVSQCDLVLYERVHKEGSPHGPRTFHRGFRLAVVTGPRIRTLSGVTHGFAPQMPVQFAFLRGEQRAPLLQLEFNDGKDKGRMVMTFSQDGERDKILKLLNGTYLHKDEETLEEVPMEGMNFSEGISDPKEGFAAVQRLPWQRARIINDRYSADTPLVVLADKLRVEVESMDKKGVGVISSITDRINVAPGELRLRLGTKNIMTLQVLRQPQQDLTVSIAENFAPRETSREFAMMQNSVARNQTVRTYRFPSFRDLHAFQAGITGYKVLFDGIATTLNISRRRMVVPIHKKWHSGTTRIQVVQQGTTTQLLAFFEEWHHGQCMGFTLKGTDTFESFNREGKIGVKLVDAKFPLPKHPAEGEPSTNEMAFVCLDLPEYAGENDDISILFDDNGERDRLCSVLPAPVKGSRGSRIM